MNGNIFVIVVLMAEAVYADPVTKQCTATYQKVEDSGRSSGETVHPGTANQTDCQAMCDPSPACLGYSWNGTTCRTYTILELTFISEPGTTQYLKTWICQACVIICYPNMAILGGTIVTVANASDCLISCLDTPLCVAFEFVSLAECRLYTEAQDKHLADLEVATVNHYRIIFNTTPPPCNGPPAECVVNPGSTCDLPPGNDCGIGTSTEEWTCNHGVPLLPTVFQMTRDCCTVPCPAGTRCSHFQEIICTAGSFTTEAACFDAGCCWVSGECYEDTRFTRFCRDVGPECNL